MLARQNRLREEADFERVKSRGRIIQSKSFGFSLYYRGDSDPSRFGFIVSNKISKDSTRRNRIKRSLSEAVRHSISYIKLGYDCVFLAKQLIVNKYTDELMNEVKKVLDISGILKINE